MKSILAVTLLASIVAGEVPSHSYLPPPPRGYPQASSPPSVIAARTLNLQNPEHQNNDNHNPDLHGDHHNGDHGVAAVRSSPQPDYPTTPIPQVRFSDEQGYDQSASGYPRNGLEDANTTVNYDSEEQGYPKTYESGDPTRSGYNENANNFRSTDSYNQDGRNNGYQGNAQNGDRYGVIDQNGGRYQQKRSNFN